MQTNPDPLIPCEIWGHYESPMLFRNRMGAQENWFYGIWVPYWLTLAPSTREVIYNAAPSDDWRDWLTRFGKMADEFRAGYEATETIRRHWKFLCRCGNLKSKPSG